MSIIKITIQIIGSCDLNYDQQENYQSIF